MSVEIVSWANGTDVQVAAILDAAAGGEIDLQRDAGWSVGDVRTIHIDAFTSGSGTAHGAQDVHIVITSFSDYNNCGNLMQFDFVECVMQERINNVPAASGNYSNTEMYTTTLPALVAALPTWLRTRLKTFDVLSAQIASPSTIDTVSGNKLALRAEYEIAGDYNPYETIARPNPGEGAQIPYYAVAEHRAKAISYWTRTVYLNATNPPETRFWFIERLGNPAGGHIVNTDDGVAPFGCLGGAEIVSPSITTQPQSQTVQLGNDAIFSVMAAGGNLRYQWQTYSDGTWYNIPGATSAIYTVTAIAVLDGSSYRCTIANGAGSITSSVVTLTVAGIANKTRYRINYTGSSKVIRRLCERIGELSILGTSHDEAYYGDQGEAAYQHSQTTGNPHGLTLADLGIEKIQDQVNALLEAIGTHIPWTRHTADERITTHDGEDIFFQTVARILEWH